jgi:hypothetical protein
VALQQLEVLARRAVDDVEDIAEHGDRADHGVERHVQQHAQQDHRGHALLEAFEDQHRGHDAGERVAGAGSDQPQDRVHTDAHADPRDFEGIVEQPGQGFGPPRQGGARREREIGAVVGVRANHLRASGWAALVAAPGV